MSSYHVSTDDAVALLAEDSLDRLGLSELRDGPHCPDSASGLPIARRNGQPVKADITPRRAAMLQIKRGFDLVVAGLAILFLAPLLAVVAVAIKLNSPGPVLFRQARVGLGGDLIHIYKFRSMRTDLCDASGVSNTKKNDPRVTTVGRFIRKTSIDELPQLFNVLRGDMSLVGPRPHVPGMLAGGTSYEKLVPYYNLRSQMRPGITGWAQANGLRGSVDRADRARGRVDHDIAYIQNFSLLLDLRIIVQTVAREFITGSGD